MKNENSGATDIENGVASYKEKLRYKVEALTVIYIPWQK